MLRHQDTAGGEFAPGVRVRDPRTPIPLQGIPTTIMDARMPPWSTANYGVVNFFTGLMTPSLLPLALASIESTL